MTSANLSLTAVGCCLLAAVVGCGQSDQAMPLSSDNDALLNELLGSVDTEAAETIEQAAADSASESFAQNGGEIGSTDDDTSESILNDILGPSDRSVDAVTAALVGDSPISGGAQNSADGSITQLSAGKAYPFVKTIQQTVVRAGQDSQTTFTALTRLQLSMVLNVLQVSDGAAVIGVRYDRVQYVQDLNGQQQAYDSAIPGSVPIAGIEPYVGMIGNGFQFSLSDTNGVSGTENLNQFLDRCVEAVPAERRQQTRTLLASRFGEHAVSQLVDESIGLVPFGASKPRSGDVWVINQSHRGQAPTATQTTCRMVSDNGPTAEVGLIGKIETLDSESSAFSISDGRSMGTCFVDQVTGLPVHSQRSSYLRIASSGPDGQPVSMNKRIETTFTAQTEQGRLIVMRSASGSTAARQPIALGSVSAGVAPFASNQMSPGGTPTAASYETRSAMLPGPTSGVPAGNQFGGLNVQPVSSSNSTPTTTPQIPLSDLQSTTEAVYPD